ncbi:MAG: alpha/beta hydrolase [Pseudonocardiales bacterium]
MAHRRHGLRRGRRGRAAGPISSAAGTEPGPAAVRDDSLTIPTGGRLHYQCQGAGSPAVILEAGGAGAGSFSSTFTDPLAAVTTVCTYDRLGLGSSSSPPNRVRALDDMCEVQDELIAGLGLPAPYVLMGQSLGGNIVIWCAARHTR